MTDSATEERSEPRNQAATTKVTADELRKLKVVAAMYDTSVSSLLHEMSVQEAVDEFDRKQAA